MWLRGRAFESCYGQEFHFVILGFRSLQPEYAHANENNHDILQANTLF